MRTNQQTSFLGIYAAVAILAMCCMGCGDDVDKVRAIQAQRQSRIQANSQQDHLGESFSLLSRLVELNQDQANRQLTYHLNRWRESRELESVEVTELIRTVSEVLPTEAASERIERENFTEDDIPHLRDCYLFNKIVDWVDDPQLDDSVLVDWFKSMEPDEELGLELTDKLRTASRLFDWTVRNVAYEPQLQTGGPKPPKLSFGMEFQGAGYRQTDYQTVWRGTGDAFQRAGVFTQLCRQASIPAFILALPSESGELKPWCVGVLVGEEIYLFEPELGTFVPGPNQVGIATLAQARTDASVLRRLNVPGFFDYPISKADAQQCTALLNVVPEAISPRMKNLESGLTGDRRMKVFVPADELAEQIDQVSGIAGVRLWNVPLMAEVYQAEIAKEAERDPLFAFWYFSRWAILEAQIDMSQSLAMARWRHLLGEFDNDEDEAEKGARVLYLTQRAPEFEIEDLEIDVDLQQAYGVRRDLGVDTQTYQRQIQQAQGMMRLGKRTATYWISLIQYDDGRYETAESWFRKRVLDEKQLSHWVPAAQYNRARTLEQMNEFAKAIEIYKTEGAPQEHGNRIRARLISKSAK